MKKLFVILPILILLNIISYSQNLDSVVIRADNDISTFTDTLSPKEIMLPELKARISKLISDECKKLGDNCADNNIYVQTFKINIDQTAKLYVTELNESIQGFQIFLSLYDPGKKMYSDFFNIDGTFMINNEQGFEAWNGRLIDKPYITFADLDGDGIKEVLFQRRAHNGTWNAVETIVLKPDLKTGELKKYFSFYSKELKDNGTETMIIRKIKSIKDGKATLGVTANDMTFHIDNPMPDEVIIVE